MCLWGGWKMRISGDLDENFFYLWCGGDENGTMGFDQIFFKR